MNDATTTLRSATGVVLAGGRSRRFGDTEKALVEFDGRPMLVHVVETLASVTDTVVVNCRADQRAAFEQALADFDDKVVFAIDDQPDEGPLAGLQTALAAVGTEYAIVLACDMPLVETDSLAALFSKIDDQSDAVVPQTAVAAVPTHAVYRVQPTSSRAKAAFEAGERSLQSLVSRLAETTVSVDESEIQSHSLRSIDTPAELDALDR